jgi:hypothetical protein
VEKYKKAGITWKITVHSSETLYPQGFCADTTEMLCQKGFYRYSGIIRDKPARESQPETLICAEFYEFRSFSKYFDKNKKLVYLPLQNITL